MEGEIIDSIESVEETRDEIQRPKNIPLRIIDISKATKIQEGSIRHYRNRFYRFMPVVGEGRKRRYQPYVIDVMLDIKKGFDRGLPAEEIDRVLVEKYPICQDGEFNMLDDDDEEENKLMAMPLPDQVNTMATLFSKYMPNINDSISNINNEVVSIKENMDSQMVDIKGMLEQIINENKQLKEEVKQLKGKPKGFFSKWFGKGEDDGGNKGKVD